MTAKKFEQYVASLVKRLDFVQNSTIFRNVRFDGVRQPDMYEIDIAVKFKLSGIVDFLMIVECKNWRRPVDRPVVQKLAQTRDAIAAHKAAIASPVGYAAESVAVAEANGIALWVLSKPLWTVIRGAIAPGWHERKLIQARMQFLHGLHFSCTHDFDASQIIDFAYASAEQRPSDGISSFPHSCLKVDDESDADNIPGVDPRLAATSIVNDLGKMADIPVSPPCRTFSSTYLRGLP